MSASLSGSALVISCFSCGLILLLSSRASLVFWRAGLRPALFLIGKVLSACVLVWVVPVGFSFCNLLLLLPSRVSLVSLELAFGQLFFNGQGPPCLCPCPGLILSSHALLVVSFFSCHLGLLLSLEELAFGQLFFSRQVPLCLCPCLGLLLSSHASKQVKQIETYSLFLKPMKTHEKT